MTRDEIKAELAICEKATSGPWIQADGSQESLYEGDYSLQCLTLTGERRVLALFNVHFDPVADVAFAARARELLPRVLRELDALKEALEDDALVQYVAQNARLMYLSAHDTITDYRAAISAHMAEPMKGGA